MVDDQDIGLALKLGALGADKPPANNTYYFGLEVENTRENLSSCYIGLWDD